MQDENPQAGRSTDRLLRLITVLTFIPALGFNIAHGVVSGQELPALGLLPHAFSVGLAIYELGWFNRLFKKSQYRIILQDESDSNKPSLLRILIVGLSDFIIGGSLLTCIVIGYIMIDNSDWRWYRGTPSHAILGTWATLPYIVNDFIHGYFVLKAVYEIAKRGGLKRKPASCPHCHASLHAGSSTNPSVTETPPVTA